MVGGVRRASLLFALGMSSTLIIIDPALKYYHAA